MDLGFHGAKGGLLTGGSVSETHDIPAFSSCQPPSRCGRRFFDAKGERFVCYR